MKLLLVGDIMLGRDPDLFFPEGSLQAPWGDTLPLLESADVVMGNLEMAITDHKRKRKKTFNFALPTKYATTLAPFSYLSLANNHILDFELVGMRDTIAELDRLKIGHSGAGENLEGAVRPYFLTRRGVRIGFLSACDGPASWGATKKRPGVWYVDIVGRKWGLVKRIVEHVKRSCDLLIMSIHWQANYVRKIEPVYKEFGRSLIDAGCDVIAGTSPHHLLPIEQYRGGIICYSLGDFVDDYAVEPDFRNDLGAILELEFTKKKGLRFVRTYETYIVGRQVNHRPRTCNRIVPGGPQEGMGQKNEGKKGKVTKERTLKNVE